MRRAPRHSALDLSAEASPASRSYRPPRAVLREVRALLARADRAYSGFSCPASADCCQLARTGRPPWLWHPEWMLIRARLAADGRALPAPRPDGACPFLDAAGKRCTVYADRPLGCRTFFCHRAHRPGPEPSGEMAQLYRRLEALTLSLDEEDSGPRPLLDWMNPGPG